MRRVRWRHLQPGEIGPTRVDHQRPKRESESLLDVVSELDDFVDGRLLRNRHKETLATLSIGQHLSNLIGLSSNWPARNNRLQCGGRSQERSCQARWRRVDDDQIGRPLAIEFFDLAEHQEVFESRCRRGDHVERRSRRGFAEQPANALQGEVVAEGLLGWHRAPTDATLPTERPQHDFLRSDRFATEQWSEPGSAIDGNQQHVGTLRAATIASAAATVLEPTPPFPATMVTLALPTHVGVSPPRAPRSMGQG